MLKKLYILIIFISFGLIASPVLAYTPHDGDLVKTANSPAVYYIDSTGTRHLFSTESTFFSWYTGSWKNQTILLLSESEFNQLISGKNVTARPGFALLRFNNSPRTYAILPGGKLCAALAHYASQGSRILLIPAGFETDYFNPGNCDITESQPLPDGTLLRYLNSSVIYYLQNSQRRRITTDGLTANRFRNESLITDVPVAISYAEGSDINGYEYNISSISYDLGLKNYNISYCVENWNCSDWSACSYGSQYRNCADLNNCGTAFTKPAISQNCSICAENWICSVWSYCAYGRQQRTCTDYNHCGTGYNQPITSQTCSNCIESWNCTVWGVCSTGLQYRTCVERNNCGTSYTRPALTQSCICQESWTCSGWTTCSYGWQYRTCTDNNHCGTFNRQPAISQACVCQESWSCGSWSTCQGSGSVGIQTRTCVDRNSCGTYLRQPVTSQNCKLCTENWSCTDWNTCISGRQSRQCQDLNRCGTTMYKPITSQNCY